MWDRIRIAEIRKDARTSLNKDFNGRDVNKFTLFAFYYSVPAIISILLLILKVRIDSDIANYFITAISIFAGLFFNLLLVIADKLNVRKELLTPEADEATINYVKRYKNFSEQIISQISYTIIISIVIIILMFLTHVGGWLPKTDFQWGHILLSAGKIILNGTIFYYGMRFIILLFIVLSSMYVLLLDDLKLKR